MLVATKTHIVGIQLLIVLSYWYPYEILLYNYCNRNEATVNGPLTDMSLPGMCRVCRPPCPAAAAAPCRPVRELIGTLECRVRFLLKELKHYCVYYHYRLQVDTNIIQNCQ